MAWPGMCNQFQDAPWGIGFDSIAISASISFTINFLSSGGTPPCATVAWNGSGSGGKTLTRIALTDAREPYFDIPNDSYVVTQLCCQAPNTYQFWFGAFTVYGSFSDTAVLSDPATCGRSNCVQSMYMLGTGMNITTNTDDPTATTYSISAGLGAGDYCTNIHVPPCYLIDCVVFTPSGGTYNCPEAIIEATGLAFSDLAGSSITGSYEIPDGSCTNQPFTTYSGSSTLTIAFS